jgi:hypothetical protein
MSRRPIAFNNSTKTANSIKKNKVEVGVASDNYASNPGGLTWFNGADSTNQYVIYSDTFSLGMTTLANAKPVCWASGDMTDANVLRMINGLPTRNNQAPFTTINSALAWVAASATFNMVSGTLDNIVTDGLILNLDCSQKSSYPGSGTTWYDLAGVNNGILTNSPTYSSANSGSITVDGVDDYVNLGNASSIKMGVSNFTINIWVKILTQNGGPTFRGLITSKQAPAANAGYGFYWNDSVNKFLWSTANGSSASEIFTTNTFPSLTNNWANVVMVRQNGATNNGFFYINNTYEPLISSATILNVDTTNNMNLGNTSDLYAAYWFKGTYGSVQIYNRALSAAEITQNYNAQKTKFGL